MSGQVEATPPKYLPETVVYLKQVSGHFGGRTLDMDQKGMTFLPHILIATVGDTVKFLNHDGVAHNVFSTDNGGYNLGMFNTNESRTYSFDKAGIYTQLCSVHPEMLGYVVVLQNPYAAVVGANGRFTIPDVPAGTYQVAIWNSKLKADDQSVTVSPGQQSAIHFSIKR